MSSDHTAEISRLRAGIAEMLKTVPPRVLAAGLKETKAYKAAAESGKKVMASTRSTLASAQQAYTSLASFWN